MILYNWTVILSHGSHSAKRIISIIDYITFRPIPWEQEDPAWKFQTINWSGSSFLLRPKELIRSGYSGKYSKKEMAQYVWLASLRNYPEFKITGKLSLDLLACLGKEDIINNNSLLQLVDDQVYFKFEEAPKE
jgi:hypothetical protein